VAEGDELLESQSLSLRLEILEYLTLVWFRCDLTDDDSKVFVL
jgi:hypothetical protein